MIESPITLLFSGLPVTADGFIPGISTVVLVRCDDRTVLFDTGPYAYRPILQGRLRKHGIDPASIDTVVLSHAHWDSAANADLFPNATIVLHERELAYAENTAAHDDQTPAYAGRVLRRLKLQTVSADTELSATMRIVELPGHTPGSIGLLVGDTLLAGDTVYCAADAAAGEVRSVPSADPRATESLKKALGLASVIYPGHDRPFRVGAKPTYLDDYAMRIRFFTDPEGFDEEIRIGAFAPKSFASWPSD
ncbi:MBL fold metallo-hydrolase [Rhodopseudomonas sp. B29]|uniref:MBL fold metallo-hydrolase n=1 Tax=Rhodopseudomonas sp. B29 TaxID=95607 RepID=UPI000346E90A|nr:MBL fold metallo-hydrolase [Rhodopseudomonas sp. B29]